MRYDYLAAFCYLIAFVVRTRGAGNAGSMEQLMRTTETTTRTPAMDETQTACFRLFIELGYGRSIPALHRHVTALEMNVSLRQLLRWSAQYRWTEQAKKTVAAVAAKVEAAMLEDSVAWARKQIIALRAIQTKFIEGIEGFEPDFRDYQDSVKMERLILGDPTERRDDVKTSRLVVELGEAELLDAARAIAAKRYGLPTSEEIVAIKRLAAIQRREECDASEAVCDNAR
jgi:hypothetical protein